jgi:hypothetical protein
MTSPLDAIISHFETLKERYDSGASDLAGLGKVAEECLEILLKYETTEQGTLKGPHEKKTYRVYCEKGALRNKASRPVLWGCFEPDPKRFKQIWAAMVAKADPKAHRLEYSESDRALYTCILAFACVFDLLKPTSRKTPGTYFDVVVGALLTVVSGRTRRKQITVPGENFQIPTDIVLMSGNAKDVVLVIPTKITTRERIVQAFAHQRILTEVFGDNPPHRSILLAVSELQRDEDRGVNEICVPNQVGLFHRYLGELSGMYYLDPPISYVNAAFSKELPVRTVGELLSTDLAELLKN